MVVGAAHSGQRARLGDGTLAVALLALAALVLAALVLAALVLAVLAVAAAGRGVQDLAVLLLGERRGVL